MCPSGEHQSYKSHSQFVDGLKKDTEDIIYDPYELAEKNESVEGEEPDFAEEIQEMMQKGISSNLPCSELKREITSMRMKRNASFVQTTQAFTTTILKNLADSLTNVEEKKSVGIIKQKLTRWSELFKAFVNSPSDSDFLISIVEVSYWLIFA